MKKILIGGVLGGLVFFVWTALSWMVLPWHMAALERFTNEDAVLQAIAGNAPASGVYQVPNGKPAPGQQPVSHEQMMARLESGGSALVVFRQHVDPSMGKSMAIGLITVIIGAMLVTWMLTKTTGLSYMGRVGFVTVAALAAWLFIDVPNWNWWGFSMAYTLGALADMVVGAFLAGLVIARIVKQ